MANITYFCGSATQANTNSIVRYALPNSDLASVKINTPIPFMVQKQRHYADYAGKRKSFYYGLPGSPRLTRFKTTQASHARMVLKIRKQIDPDFSLPAINKPSSVSATSALVATSNFFGLAFSATASIAQTLSRGLVNTLISVPSGWAGIPLAEAADGNALREFEDVDRFVQAFKKDFIITVSPSLKGSSLKGASLVIGEIHHQKNLEEGVLRILKHLRPEQGDMLLLEGGSDSCPNRMSSYGIPESSCVNLEAYSNTYLKARAAWEAMAKQLELTVQFIITHLPHQLPAEVLVGAEAYFIFIKAHADEVPSNHKPALNVHLRKCKELINLHHDSLTETAAKRENDMLKEIKNRMGRHSLNVVLLGAQHVVNLATNMDQKIIFMMPRIVLDTFSEMNLPIGKDEF